jgi:hypothetical protein
MPNSGGTGAGRAGDAVPSGDSPKPHGDKMAGAGRTAAGANRPGEGARGPGDAVPSGDSPKPHGDKMAGVVRGAAAPETAKDAPDRRDG